MTNNNDDHDNRNHQDDDDDDNKSISDFSIYKLDFETSPLANGGEVLYAGDHVYMWCTGYQHHAIVLEASSPDRVLIAEFTNADLPNTPLMRSSAHSSAAVSVGVSGAFRLVEEKEPSKWHKVKYRANHLECLTWRPGTCSGESPDHADRILTRVQFLYTCRHLIPGYHLLASNCEAVAVWCVTGKYKSLQVKVLDYSKAAAAGVGAVVFPVAGIAFGGWAAWHSMQVGKRCDETTEYLNKEFAVYTMGRSPLPRQWIQEIFSVR